MLASFRSLWYKRFSKVWIVLHTKLSVGVVEGMVIGVRLVVEVGVMYRTYWYWYWAWLDHYRLYFMVVHMKWPVMVMIYNWYWYWSNHLLNDWNWCQNTLYHRRYHWLVHN